MSSERWCFTAWKKPQLNEKLINYMIWQKETCPSTHLIHYQGYIEFKREYKLFQVKSLFKDKTIHAEISNKCRLANYRYCTKSYTFAEERYEFGDVMTGMDNPNWDDILV